MKRPMVLVAIAIQMAVYTSLMVWAVGTWRHVPWAGFAWQTYRGDTSLGPLGDVFAERLQSGSVVFAPPSTPAVDAGIRRGDVVTRIDNVAADDLPALTRQAAGFKPGDRLTITVARDGYESAHDVTLSSAISHPLVVIGVVTSLATGLAFLGIALLVAWARPRSEAAGVFFVLSSCAAASFVVWAASEPVVPDLRGLRPYGVDPSAAGVLAVVMVLSMAVVNLLLHFSLVFPSRRPIVKRWPEVLTWLHTVAFLPAAVVIVTFLVAAASTTTGATALVLTLLVVVILGCGLRIVRSIRREGWRTGLVHSPWELQAFVVAAVAALGPVIRTLSPEVTVAVAVIGILALALHYVVVALAWSVFTCVSLSRSYREAGAEARNQLRWPLWGLSAPILLGIVLMIGNLLYSWTGSDLPLDPWIVQAVSTGLSKIAYVLIPVSFAFGILRYRVMEIDLVIRRTLVYGGLTAFVLVAYFGVVGLLGVTVVDALGLEGQTAAVLATVVVAAVGVPVRRLLQRGVDRWMNRRRLDHDELLHRVDALGLTATTLKEFTDGLGEALHVALGPRSLVIWTAAEDRESLRPSTSIGVPESLLARLRLAMDDPHVTAAGATDIKGPANGPLRMAGVSIAAAARSGGEAMGLISLGPPLATAIWDQDQRELLATIADRLAMAIGRLRRRSAEVDALEARRIQESLLPRSMPSVEGISVAARWEPAREVSGDGYDVLTLNGGRLAVTITDVSGKGTPAALLMSNVQAAARSVIGSINDPAEVARRIRDVVSANLMGGRFVTFCYLEIDPGRATVTWANLGHEPPVLVRANGTIERLGATGPAIARLLATLPITARTLDVESGDRIVLCTDGVTEAVDRAGTMFGDRRLEAAIIASAANAVATVTSVAATVQAWSENRLRDDLTLVAIAIDPTVTES